VPTYEYYCPRCKIIFEQLLLSRTEIRKYAQEHPCDFCGDICRRIPSATNFQFKGVAEGDPTRRGNSGVHDLDYPSLDKAIGRSSNRKWKEFSARKQERDKVRRESGSNALSVSPDGQITSLDARTLDVRDRAFKIFKNAKDRNQG